MNIFINSHQVISNYSLEEANRIKGDLTKPNPLYKSAQMFSPYKRVYVPEFLYYYKEDKKKKTLTVPRGYSIPFNHNIIGEEYAENTVTIFPEFQLELRDAQKNAAKAYLELENTGDSIIVMPTGSGKAETLDTKILTPTGYKLMRDIEIGDKVIGEDGDFYSVSGVYPQGVKDVYELTFKDGTKTKCCKEHLWKYATANMLHCKRGRYKVAELQEIMKEPLKIKRGYNFNIPINKPVKYSDRKVLIPPYVLGLLLGDGCLNTINGKQCNVYFSNTEEDVINNLNNMIGDLGEFVYNKSSQCQYLFRNNIEGIKHSRFVQEILRLRLNVLGEFKFIPEEYKYNSIEKRLELLKGLFDTDGNVGSNGSYRFSSSSSFLIKDVEFLCRSLGYRTNLKVINRVGKIRKVNAKDYKIKNLEYVLTILTNDIIFKSKKHLERKEKADKQYRPEQKHKYDVLSVVGIQYVGKQECQCIMVDSKDHTYLCDDFIVTHNTIVGLYLASVLRQKTLIIVNKDDLISGWKDDAKLCFGKDFKPGLIKAKKFDIGEQITLATIQTLSKLPEDKLNIVKKTFNTIIVDEQHRAAAKTYSFVNNMPAYNRIGLTATDIRNDGLRDVLTFYFGNVVYRCSEEEVKEDIISADKIEVKIKESDIFYKEAKRYRWVDDGALVTEIELLKPNKIITSKDKEWKDAIKELLLAGEIKKIPLNVAKINNIINGNEEFLRGVCKDIAEEYFLGKSCVVFCKEKELVRKLGSLLNSFNVPENQLIYYYGDSKINKAEMKKIAESKESLITLTTLAMATEGTNVKAWERIFLVSSIANRKDLIQAIGRVRRTKEGKDLVRIYDYSHPYIDGVRQHISVRLKYYEEKGFKITQ